MGAGIDWLAGQEPPTVRLAAGGSGLEAGELTYDGTRVKCWAGRDCDPQQVSHHSQSGRVVTGPAVS